MTLYRSGTSAPRHRGYEAAGNPLPRHRDGLDCVFQDRQASQSVGPQKSALRRSCGQVFSEFDLKSTPQASSAPILSPMTICWFRAPLTARACGDLQTPGTDDDGGRGSRYPASSSISSRHSTSDSMGDPP